MKQEFKGYYEALGQNVAYFRRGKGLTQHQLAQLVGVERSHIAAIELGRVGISCDVIFKLCDVLDVAPKLLLDIGA